MRIANPIYDIVFKYLMEDEESARLIIGEIIDTEVLEVSLMPQERVAEVKREERAPLSVYRLDFSALIRVEGGGQSQVIIEIQKAKFSTDIQRFRRYLGDQYRKGTAPIITIYFLGHHLEHIQAPVIKVDRSYIDRATGDLIREKEEFIESLTHNSYVIQIPYLTGHRRNDLEKMLSLFDQSRSIADEGNHFMSLREEEIPVKYLPLVRRLRRAQEEEEIRDTMDVEDDILAELMDKERLIERLDQTVQEKDKALEEKDKALEENQKTLEENQKTLEEKDKALEEKDRMIAELMNQLDGEKK